MRMAFVSVAIVFGAAACGCERRADGKIIGSGVAKTEVRSVGDFDEIELNGQGSIELSIGLLQPLEVTADDNILPLIKTDSRGRRLVVQIDGPLSAEVGVMLRATVPDIKVVSCEGAARVYLHSIQNESLLIEVNGAGAVVARGTTENLVVFTRGAGHIDVGELQARNVDITVTGTGSVVTNATDKLNVEIAGAGVVRYSGDPELQKNVRGLGVVTRE